MASIVITGATSGIGRAVALEFARRHSVGQSKMILCYHSDDGAARRLDSELMGIETRFVKADLGRREGLDAVLRAVRDFGPIDYVSYNVGIGAYVPFCELTTAEWDRVMFANLTAPIFLVQGLMQNLMPGGSILFNGSCSGISPHSTSIAYGVSKAALHFAARSLVKELESFGVRVNAIAPGFIDTPRNATRPSGSRKRIEAKTALHRFGTSEEVARATLDILENTFINGAVISVDGGYEYF